MLADILSRARPVLEGFLLHLEVDAQPVVHVLEVETGLKVREVEEVFLAAVDADEAEAAILLLAVDDAGESLAELGAGGGRMWVGDAARLQLRVGVFLLCLLLLLGELGPTYVAVEVHP